MAAGQPRFRKSNKQPDGSYPPVAHENGVSVRPKGPSAAELEALKAGDDIKATRDLAAHEAIAHLRWQMLHAPSLKAKERAARKLAELGVPRPAQEIGIGKADSLEPLLVRVLDGEDE